MPRQADLAILFSIFLLLLQVCPVSSEVPCATSGRVPAHWSGGLIIDHTCTDLNAIPAEWIEAAKSDVKVHYAHTSHGGQITTGLDLIEDSNSTFSQVQGDRYLPIESGALSMLDGNPPESYITPDLYWETSDGLATTQNTLDENPTLTVSIWSWCTQLYWYGEAETQSYLDAMSSLETANPNVIFVYMTCNAQSTGDEGYNRWLRNEQIRQYCMTNDKVLFDFEDLDAWSDGEQSTYVYGDYYIPVEHEDFHGDQAGHTTYTSCEQKGRAFWWMVAALSGWVPQNTDGTTSSTTTTTPDGSILDTSFLLTTGLALTVVLIAAVAFKYHRS
ncbi:MAG: hypothetical protein C4K49_12725 [Candidatus Thorarchaeota archaeon]|nr:MAG: hypothetical protein C4K49_12725 [Candidatus Thorarchaeota archaeon]